MRTIATLFLCLFSLTVQGQVSNTTRRDTTNIYVHALDSASRLILTKFKPKYIFAEGDVYAINRLPDKINGVPIIIDGKKKKIKAGPAEAIVTINRLEIEDGEFKIFIQLWTIENGQRRILEGGTSGYTFNYEFDQGDKSFRLIRIDKAIMIR